jgi:CheY-like chemotaxis protein
MEIGYSNVTSATCTDEAKKFLGEQEFDLILSDWHMPGESGLELLKYIRSVPTLTKIPFVMITTENDKSRIIEAVKIGMQAYMFKPVQKNTLAQKLAELAAQYKFQPPTLE